MRSFRAAVAREVRRLFHDRFMIAFAIVGPWIVFALLAAIFVREVPTELPVAVVDLDHSAFSRTLVRMLDASPTLLVVPVLDRAEAQRSVLSGESYAIVEIPRDAERDLKRGHSITTVCSTNAQLLLPASLIRRAVRTVVGTASAGVELKMRTARGATTAEAMTRFEPLRLDVHSLFNPRLSYVLFLLTAAIPAALQVFIVMAAIWTTALELREGTDVDWLETSGGTVRALLAKAIVPVTLFTAVALIAQRLVFLYFDLPLEVDAALLLATLLFVVSSVAIGIAIGVGAANLRFGLSVGAFYSGPAFAFAGITFPLIGMPPLARAWSALIPLTHFLRVISGSLRGMPPVAGPLIAMATLTMIASAIAFVRARRVLGNPRYRGRM